MAACNGVFRKMTIAPELEKHIFKRIDVMQPGDQITDYMNERISYLYYFFDDRNEMVEMAEHMNDMIEVDIEERKNTIVDIF